MVQTFAVIRTRTAPLSWRGCSSPHEFLDSEHFAAVGITEKHGQIILCIEG
jgi:hypothetical protein